ncbi:S8 family peptidase [Arcicella sp. LKC2W]|uniref:S8 family peptidase n=1 Tax=Arcicella sp. LKC2W TaxID=2984198 RepID=UPI002B1FAE1E|nr:S8 family peptidase [Arcicella sp. LKC2W]MEA5457919.1 S8 family peptidase [Arcicella sp. LKC2W]
MAELPHLQLRNTYTGTHKPKNGGGGAKKSPITLGNLVNRLGHGQKLQTRLGNLEGFWKDNLRQRKEDGFPDLPESEVVPILLELDPNFDIESLKSLGIEIVLEEENGFVVGATAINFVSLKEKIDALIQERGQSKDQLAKLWEIEVGIQWRLEHILSEELSQRWSSIADDEILILDVAIACYVKKSPMPVLKKRETEEKYQIRLENWRKKTQATNEKRGDIELERQDLFEKFIRDYGGENLSGFIDNNDSFCCQIQLSAKAMKDLALNYQYLFYLSESEQIESFEPNDIENNLQDDTSLQLIAPLSNAPKVCVIDSGIQESHRLLDLAIDVSSSKSYVLSDNSTADYVSNGGHGTKVAGAILYPRSIPTSGIYSLPCWIQNARVLNKNNVLDRRNTYLPKLMEDIISDFLPTKIYNLSIASKSPCRLKHMTSWAASIDKLTYENDVLFIVATGNLGKGVVKNHLDSSRQYPNFLLEKSSRISNPSQSSFALTVGSVSLEEYKTIDEHSFGENDDPSAFTKSGPGLWGMIKPDVVEYGGDFVLQKIANIHFVKSTDDSSVELVQSTLRGNKSIGKDIGTSFATPKVTHIAAMLQSVLPNDDALLYRALIAQSARLPKKYFQNPTSDNIRLYGYGIPDVNRATGNTDNRITFIASDHIAPKQAKLYSVNIPESIRKAGDNYDILIEFTLSYKANPRRTRMKTKSYLSTWVDWVSSKNGQSFEQFKVQVIKDLESGNDLINVQENQDTIHWAIRERSDYGKIKDFKRQDSTLQKDWCILKSNQLPEELSFAIIGHKGWEVDLSQTVPFAISISIEALENSIAIYEKIKVENEVQIQIEI